MKNNKSLWLSCLMVQTVMLLRQRRWQGYADTTATSDVIKGLKDEIAEATKKYMARVAPKAAVAMGSALVDPTELGIRDKMTAARDLLDRTGFMKTEDKCRVFRWCVCSTCKRRKE